MEDCVHPVCIRLDIVKSADITCPVNVNGEGVLVFPGFLIEVTICQNGINRKAKACIEL